MTARLTIAAARVGPSDCRERQRELGLPYPKSSCHHCGPIISPGWQCPYEAGGASAGAPTQQPTLAAVLAERAPEFLAAARELHSIWRKWATEEVGPSPIHRFVREIDRADLIAQEPRTTFHLTPQQFQEMHNAG